MFRHVLLVWTMLSVESSTAQDCSVHKVSDSLQRTLNSLLQPSALDGSANHDCSRVEIPAGDHVLSAQVAFPAELRSLELVGSTEERVSITCSYAAEQNYTWYFSRLESLKIHHIHFHNCPRPLRIDTVSEVEVINSSYRSDTDTVYHSLLQL